MKINIPKDQNIVVDISSTIEADKITDILRDNLDIAYLKETNSVSYYIKDYYDSAFQIGFNKGRWITISEDLTNGGSSTEWKNPISLQQFINKYEVKEELKKELVHGKYNIGDIVVSLSANSYRQDGDMFEVQPKSTQTSLFFIGYETSSSSLSEWRIATQEEYNAFNYGIRNIIDIKPPKKSLIQQVNEKYKKGDSVIDLVNKVEWIVKEDDSAQTMSDSSIYVNVAPREGYNNKSARVYKEGEWAKKVSSYEPTVKNEKEVVNVKTQEQWDFVTKKLGYVFRAAKWRRFKQSTCIHLTVKKVSQDSFCKTKGYIVTDFPAWLAENKFIEEWNDFYLKERPRTSTEIKEEVLRVGNSIIAQSKRFNWPQDIRADLSRVNPQHFMCGCDMADPNSKDVSIDNIYINGKLTGKHGESIKEGSEVKLRSKRKSTIFKGAKSMNVVKTKIK